MFSFFLILIFFFDLKSIGDPEAFKRAVVADVAAAASIDARHFFIFLRVAVLSYRAPTRGRRTRGN